MKMLSICSLGIILLSSLVAQAEPTAELDNGSLRVPSLPHVTLNIEERYLDVDALVCKPEDKLELIACTLGTKEHESVIAIKAEARHVHLMLILLGAKQGKPYHREPIDDSGKRFRDIPASGQAIDVTLVYTNENDKQVERPVADFIRNEAGEPLEVDGFVFTGSLAFKKDGVPHYLADRSGNFMTISTFGDEVIGMPTFQSHANADLLWHFQPDDLPAVDSLVTLRLRPRFAEATE